MPNTTRDGKIIWRMRETCPNCPFSNSKAGRELKNLLRGERWEGIAGSLLKGGHFLCHQTTREDGFTYDEVEPEVASVSATGATGYDIQGPELVCAGSIDWQAKRGITSDLAQVMERMGMLREMIEGECAQKNTRNKSSDAASSRRSRRAR